jgi:general stress protein 26
MAIESTFDGRNRRGDVKMTPHEIEEFFATGPDVMTLATVNGDGSIHLAAVAFAFIGGVIWAKSKARAQKVINIRLHPFASCMMSDGDDAYETMRATCLPEAR